MWEDWDTSDKISVLEIKRSVLRSLRVDELCWFSRVRPVAMLRHAYSAAFLCLLLNSMQFIMCYISAHRLIGIQNKVEAQSVKREHLQYRRLIKRLPRCCLRHHFFAVRGDSSRCTLSIEQKHHFVHHSPRHYARNVLYSVQLFPLPQIR